MAGDVERLATLNEANALSEEPASTIRAGSAEERPTTRQEGVFGDVLVERVVSSDVDDTSDSVAAKLQSGAPVDAAGGVLGEKDAGKDRVFPLNATPPFDRLTAETVAILQDTADERQYEDGETIAAAGQFDGSEFLVIRAGAVNIAAADPDTGAILLERVSAPGVIGLAQAVALSNAPSALDVSTVDSEQSLTAAGAVVLSAVETAAFSERLVGVPEVTQSLMRYFAAALAQRPMTINPDGGGEQRVYGLLVEAAERIDGVWRINTMPKHRELADSAQVSETIAANAVARIIRDGVAVRDYPALEIRDMGTLRRLAR
ncbi:MAG: hypothetical protein AAF224_00890 [Pseudomonadota bacterium]